MTIQTSTFETLFGQSADSETTEINVSVNYTAASVTGLIGRLEASTARQAADPVRQTYVDFQNRVIVTLKKMSSVSLSRKFARTFGYQGCFNPFNVEADERQEMIGQLLSAALTTRFGDYRPERSAVIELQAVKTLFGIGKTVGRFDEDDIRAIRTERLVQGTSYRKLGKRYGVSGDMVRSICIGESYANVHVNLIEGR